MFRVAKRRSSGKPLTLSQDSLLSSGRGLSAYASPSSDRLARIIPFAVDLCRVIARVISSLLSERHRSGGNGAEPSPRTRAGRKRLPALSTARIRIPRATFRLAQCVLRRRPSEKALKTAIVPPRREQRAHAALSRFQFRFDVSGLHTAAASIYRAAAAGRSPPPPPPPFLPLLLLGVDHRQRDFRRARRKARLVGRIGGELD